MAYEILMPQLSDSMDEGKLISWKVQEGDSVQKGDVIAEVESDKAIMEVQSFQSGVVTKLALKEGESVPVGSLMASIETDAKLSSQSVQKPQKKEEEKPPKTTVQKAPIQKQTRYHDSALPKAVQGDASAKAKALASRYNIDINSLQARQKLPIPAHEEDIKTYHLAHYFTPKALKLLQQYHLDSTLFTPDKKYDSSDILAYIKAHDIPRPSPLDSFQKALILAVETSAKKPIYHIYDRIDATLMQKHSKHTLTVWLLKLFAEAMMAHDVFRSILKDESIMITPNASISLAISDNRRLYMPVFKDVNLLTPIMIEERLKEYEQKAKDATMSAGDFQGATFGISNLGMFGIERFDAMINKEECGIAAIGGIIDGAIMITLTLDHRLVNGYEGAQFMQTLKSLALDATFFKER